MPAGRRVRGTVRVPGSKSAAHRHLNLALLARQPVVIEGLPAADDIGHFLRAMETLGWEMVAEGGTIRLAPPVGLRDEATLFAGNAGTLCRFLTASLTVLPGRWRLDGDPRLRERPVGPLVRALRALGGEIEYRGEEGRPPLAIRGPSLRGGETRLYAGTSSQYLSALMMAGLAAPEPSRVAVESLVSAPYVDLTLRVVGTWGGRVDWDGGLATVGPGIVAPEAVRVEGDDSAAAYPAAAAVLTGGEVEIEGLDRGSRHGDRRFLEILERMGGRVEWLGDRLRVAGTGDLLAVDEDMGDVPDQVPTLAALAPFARGTTRIRNVPHLRVKESDRLAAMAIELRRAGASVREGADSLELPGVWAEVEPPGDPVTLASWDDHRIAMGCALVGLRRPGVTIATPEVVSKSYPGFWTDLEALLR